MIGAAIDTCPGVSSPISAAQPRSTAARELPLQPLGVADRRVGEDCRPSVVTSAKANGVVGEQHLTQRGGVRRQQRAHVERLQAVVGAEHVMDDQHLLVMQRADPHRLVGARRQRVDQFSARVRNSLPSR